MKGLVTKELITIYRNFMFQIIVFAVFGFIGAIADIQIMIMFVPLIMSVLTISVTAIDETTKWSHYSMTLPVERKTIVNSKYITVLINSLTSTLIVMLFILLNMAIKKDFSAGILFTLTAASLAAGFIFPSLLLPFYLKFGAAKGKIMYYISIGAICSLVSLLMTSFNIVSENITQFASDRLTVLVISIIAAVIMPLVSWLISTAVYKNKELNS